MPASFLSLPGAALLAGTLLGLSACSSSPSANVATTPQAQPARPDSAAVAGAPTPRLEAVFQGDTPWVGIAVSDAERAFVLYPRPTGAAGIRIAEMKDGKPVPYPSAAWNDWRPGQPVASKFVRVNSLRIGPDGLLWVVDTGTTKMGGEVLPGAAKLVAIDLATNRVVRTIPLGGVLKPKSFVDDVRFYGNTIYLTDAGAPALMVLDKQTGQGRRVLENDSSTTDRRPMLAEGVPLTKPDGSPVLVHADQLEVSPDGKYLYFQPSSGPLYRVETRYLLDKQLPAAALSRQVHLFYNTHTTGGTAIDASGNLFVSDPDSLRILRITPAAKATVVVQDKRLLWPDAMWIDSHGSLWIPAAQLNRVALLHGGVDAVRPPVYIYRLPLGLKSFRS